LKNINRDGGKNKNERKLNVFVVWPGNWANFMATNTNYKYNIWQQQWQKHQQHKVCHANKPGETLLSMEKPGSVESARKVR